MEHHKPCMYHCIGCREKFTVHKTPNGPLDMDQFRMLFCTCKIPGIMQDSIANYFKTGKLS